MYSNKSVDECFSDQRTYSKSPQGMSSKKVCDKSYSESGQSFYDSSRTDSGFLSGNNLVSDQNLSSDDLSSPVSPKPESDFDTESKNNSETYMRLDSGVDLGINKQFSELTLQPKVELNDLNTSVRNKHDVSLGVSELLNFEEICKDGQKYIEHCALSSFDPWQPPYKQDDHGDTELHIAIIQGSIEKACILIRLAPHPYYLDLLNDVAQSPLHLAVLTHQAGLVRLMVVSGANAEQQDRHGNTPLHLACQIGDFDCVKALTKPVTDSEMASAHLSHSERNHQIPQNLDERNYEGETCLHLAAYGGYIEILRHLIWFGADINAREGKSGRTILHQAVESRNIPLFRFLLGEWPIGPNGLRIDTPDYAGHTPYQLACIIDPVMMRELIERGANLEVEDIEDDHPDHNAEDAEDEISEMDSTFSNLDNCQQSREAVRV